MDTLTRIIWIAGFASAFGASFWFAGWLHRRQGAATVQKNIEAYNTMNAAGDANTKAIEENTAAIRELIRKLDEQKKS